MLRFSNSLSVLIYRVRELIPADTPIYLVGGAIRDAILERQPIRDLDFVLQGDVLSLSRKAANALGAAYFPLDEERSTARLILPSEHGEKIRLDFSLMRGPDIETDLKNRDFTVNALAQSLGGPDILIDPLGGLQHLREKLLVQCSGDAFRHDPIRGVRGVRLAVDLGFRILPETTRLMRQAAPWLSRTSSERIRDELFHILEGSHPALAIRLLDRLEILPYILPELQALKGLDQPAPHVLDAFDHTLDALNRLGSVLDTLSVEHNQEHAATWARGLISVQLGRFRVPLGEHLQQHLNADRTLRGVYFLAALYHDSGKAATRQLDENNRVRFLGHEKIGAELAVERARQLHLSNDESTRLGLIIENHMRPLLLSKAGAKPTRRAVYRYFRATGEAGIDVGLLSLADVLAIYGATLPETAWANQLDVVRSLFEAWWEKPDEAVSPPALVSGHDLIETFSLQPGPQIGELLETIREAQAIGQVTSRAEALTLAGKQVIQSRSRQSEELI